MILPRLGARSLARGARRTPMKRDREDPTVEHSFSERLSTQLQANRKCLEEHVDATRAALPAGWNVYEVPSAESCDCNEYERDPKCGGQKNCCRCERCSRADCMMAGDFYIHRPGDPECRRFCLGCSDVESTAESTRFDFDWVGEFPPPVSKDGVRALIGPAIRCGNEASVNSIVHQALKASGLTLMADGAFADASGRKIAEQLVLKEDTQGPCWIVLSCLAEMNAAMESRCTAALAAVNIVVIPLAYTKRTCQMDDGVLEIESGVAEGYGEGYPSTIFRFSKDGTVLAKALVNYWHDDDALPGPNLQVIAVARGSKRRGIGRSLLHAIEVHYRELFAPAISRLRQNRLDIRLNIEHAKCESIRFFEKQGCRFEGPLLAKSLAWPASLESGEEDGWDGGEEEEED